MNGVSIKNFLTDSDISMIYKTGRKPLLAAYRIAHEGVSTGPIVGMGRAAKEWSASNIGELAERIKGAPVYVGHRVGSGPRRAVGYVLRGKKIDGANGAEAVAIVAVEDPRAAEEIGRAILDTASIEADLVIEPGDNSWRVMGVENVTGLALASSKKNPPGFDRAELLAATRELDADDNETSTAQAPPASDDSFDVVVCGEIDKLKLTESERNFVNRRLAERVPERDADPSAARTEIALAIRSLDEAKRIYRKPAAAVSIPFERRKGPHDYTNPEHNELIPAKQRGGN